MKIGEVDNKPVILLLAVEDIQRSLCLSAYWPATHLVRFIVGKASFQGSLALIRAEPHFFYALLLLIVIFTEHP